VNEAIAGTCLAGINTRRIKGALRPFFKAAPLSRRCGVADGGHAQGLARHLRSRSLEELEVVYPTPTASRCGCTAPGRW
jgi:hypothetical protein